MALAASPAHCALCFSTVVQELGVSVSGDGGPASYNVPGESDRVALFVTWKVPSRYSNEEWDLRGCIGNLSPIVLGSGLRRYAIVSSMEDRRFNPISARELPMLQCTVSLLVDFEEGLGAYEWGNRSARHYH